MKKYVVFILLILFICIPYSVNASSGYLTSSTVKKCPNGKWYGSHAGHWHRAVKRNGRWFASGSKIKNDPCPYKSDNNLLEDIYVDGEEIWPSYWGNITDKTIKYETYKSKISIKANAYDDTAKVKVNNKTLVPGNNKIIITVTAENGQKRNYTLLITRLVYKPELKSLKINGNDLDLKDSLVYETYDNEIKIETVAKKTGITISNDYTSLKSGENIININLVDEEGRTNTYKVKVILKQKDLSLKTLKIDGEEVKISDEMSYETLNENLEIETTTVDETVKVSNDNRVLSFGENIITITTSDDKNNKKEYKLNVNLKKRNITLKTLTIDDKNVEISGVMRYTTIKDDIVIDASSNEENVTITNDYNGLVDGENTIMIKLSDELGNNSEYKLIVNKEQKIEPIVDYFKIGVYNVDLGNTENTLLEVYYPNFDFDIHLGVDDGLHTKVYLNDKEIGDEGTLNPWDKYKIVVYNDYGDQKEYNIDITVDIVLTIIFCIILLTPVWVILIIVKIIKRKKKKH